MDGGQQCRLLAGPAALAAQLVLGIIAFSSLLYKRHIERPQRPLNIWGFDVSKQAVSMLAAHICGMTIALIAHRTTTAASECAWYFVAFSFDTSLGLGLTIALHRAALRGAAWWEERQRHAGGAASHVRHSGLGGVSLREPWHEALRHCGDYGDPPSLRRWGLQLGEWVACVVLARAACGTLVVLLHAVLVGAALWLDARFYGHPVLLLFVVMLAGPLMMNMLQFVIQDVVLKGFRKGGSSGVTSAAAAGSGKREGSVGGPSPQLQQLSERSGLMEGTGARSDAPV